MIYGAKKSFFCKKFKSIYTLDFYGFNFFAYSKPTNLSSYEFEFKLVPEITYIEDGFKFTYT